MFVFNLGGQGRAVRRRGVRAEPRLFFGTEMLWTVGGGYHFDVGECGLRSLVRLIVDSSIGNLNLVADEWQVEPFGDLLLNLSEVPFRFGFPGGIQSFLQSLLRFC